MLRAAIYFGWLLASWRRWRRRLDSDRSAFVIAYMRLEKRAVEAGLPQALGLTLLVWVVFERLLSIPWPQTILGSLVPAFKVIPLAVTAPAVAGGRDLFPPLRAALGLIDRNARQRRQR